MTVFTDAAAKVIKEWQRGPDNDSPEYKDLVVRQLYYWWPNLFQLLDELAELPPPTNGDSDEHTGTTYWVQAHKADEDVDSIQVVDPDDLAMHDLTDEERAVYVTAAEDQDTLNSSQFLADQNDRADQLHPVQDDETQVLDAVREDDSQDDA